MEDLKSKKICVLMGGRSGERDVSLRSGKKVFDSLQKQGFNVVSMDLDDDLVSKLKQEKIDIVYNILHGRFGEDGVVQGLLEMANIPYTGSKVLASALAMNKLASKRVFDAVGVPTPKYLEIDSYSDIKKEADRTANNFPLPFIMKPISEGSSLGVVLIKDEKDILPTLEKLVGEFKDVFIEEYVKGREVTVGILGKNGDLTALPVLELVSKNEFYDFDAKYTEGMTEFVLPARLPGQVYKKTQEIAMNAHRVLGCYGVSRVDMIVGPDNIPYVHDVNTIPGMTDRSDLPAEAAHAGISFDQLVLKILESAY
ncbi:MAG: D-alanine--D-alanine ligase [Candidatus Margulisiibacteriota bacterium]|nr:D-alanine--D-alanine ligase [Candidatus Margulisiibacteriota bacterium]